jgi:hypothetical protein
MGMTEIRNQIHALKLPEGTERNIDLYQLPLSLRLYSVSGEQAFVLDTDET